MSRLYVARELHLDRDVVIKVLPPDLRTVTSVARFQQEIRVTARLLHPHILPVLAAGGDESLLYYVAPYIWGGSLRDHLSTRGPLPADAAASVATEVLAGLAHAHARGVVHRDIKPGNVLLSNGHALLADFGIASALEAMHRLDAGNCSVAPPRAYRAPEDSPGEAADLYAVGALLFEMLTARPPDADTSVAAVSRALADRHGGAQPETLRALALVIARALCPDPARRFNSARAFRAALRSPRMETLEHRLAREALMHLQRGDSRAAMETLQRVQSAGPGLPVFLRSDY